MKERAMLEHDISLKWLVVKMSQMMCSDTLTILHCVVLGQILQIAGLHAHEIIYLE
jgi:hypothetical protein